MPVPEIELLTSYVSQVFRVEDVTAGGGLGEHPAQAVVARYRGRLINEDSVAAYDHLDGLLRPYHLTALFRKDGDKQIILLVPSLALPERSPRVWINVVLFVITIFAVMLTGVEVPLAVSLTSITAELSYRFQHILSGWPFAVAMLGILFTHEMGHYVMCRRFKVPATLPYFLPAPILSPFGTMGAFIMMRGIPKNKRVLFDVGVAGPLAGLVVAIPVLFLGLSLSTLGRVDVPPPGMQGWIEGNSLFYLLAKFLVFGRLLPEPASMGGLSTAAYWIKYFLSAHPIPFGGMDVMLNPIALAGWGGLLVTALNLVPLGTLDGGHVAYGLFGENARRIFPIAIGTLIFLSVLPVLLTGSLAAFNFGWLLWIFILFWLGKVRTVPLDDITELDPGRRVLGFFVLFLFFLLFTPIPMVTY
jgi:membrane-associated protease RseP (regulator of RpoE activity)